ncbi:MAG: HPF/RaiA family ribosome-associated protein [Verrucomicrobia bacterium]|nr:HPF/RaiA family ribosome-associated protein [Verrucomicrobiota bacterium]
MQALAHFPWNLVTRGFHAHEQIQQRLRRTITKLERHLAHFPADAVHLQVTLERHPKKTWFTAALVLRVPSNILRGEGTGTDPVPALAGAVKHLLRQLTELKSELRREVFWKRKTRRAELHDGKPRRFAAEPQPAGSGPQELRDVVRALLAEHHARLLRYVRRHLWHEVTLGELPQGAIDPRAVVDEVARRALAAPEKKPAKVGALLWLYILARQELARRRRALRQQAEEVVPLESPRALPEDAEAAAGYEPEQPLEVIEETLQPPLAETRDVLADPGTAAPDQLVAAKDLLDEMQRAASAWPKTEREAFELYFVEGLEPDEIGMVLGLRPEGARKLLENIRGRLRATLLDQAML